MRLISRNKLRNFVKSPHIPFGLLAALGRVSPAAARLLKYGRPNLNTEKYWNKRYESEDYEDERYGALRYEVMKLVPTKAYVLDAGCGTGALMECLRDQKDCMCIGLDISGAAIDIVKKKGLDAIKCKLPDLSSSLPAKHFDVCTIIETLEHIWRPERTVKTLFRVLKPGGFIIAGVPDDCMRPEEFDEHMCSFTSETLRDLLGRHFTVDVALSVESDGVKYLVMRARKDRDVKRQGTQRWAR